jgi:signal peptidase I
MTEGDRSMSPETRIVIWTRDLCDAALILLVALCLLTIALGRVVPLTGRTTLVVAGGSMEPAISLGSAIVVEPVDSLAVGDVVSLRSGAQRAVFTHRVIRVVVRDGTTWVETKGDANATADPSLTPASQIIGRASVTIPNAGYLIALLSSLHGIIFVISLGLVLLLAATMVETIAPAGRRETGPQRQTVPDPRRRTGRSRQTEPVSRRQADPT